MNKYHQANEKLCSICASGKTKGQQRPDGSYYNISPECYGCIKTVYIHKNFKPAGTDELMRMAGIEIVEGKH